MDYQFKDIEQKWQKFWAGRQTFKAEDNSSKPKYYVLDMFPYPSGAGLHVGHPLGYIASDIFARYKRLKGFNVLHPMGYDSFGLPAEQYAIQTGQHPAITTETNIATYRRQLDQIGFSFDWSREVRTSSPDYYKWTQWIFMQLFNSWYNKDADKAENIDKLIAHFEQHGSKGIDAVSDEEVLTFSADEWQAMSHDEKQAELLKYRLTYLRESTVNWCPALGTVLANDEVKDGFSERGGYPVEQKKMMQWSMRITAYAQRLLEGLDTIDWPEPLKEMQRNWIGKSVGALVRFSLTPALSKGEGAKKQGFETADITIWEALKTNSRLNRQNSTQAEDILWQVLRNNQTGYKIRRQHAIDGYIADFVCLGKGLVIEVDGDYHDFTIEQDAIRTSVLNSEGFEVIRFKNDEVIHQTQRVVDTIKERLDNSQDRKIESANTSLSFGEGRGEAIEVFTTRVDTIFGVTFLVIAPEHELVSALTTPEQKDAIEAYIAQTKKKSELDRMADTKTVSGAFTGSYVINPLNGDKVQVWIADYVLAGYGTGAVMAVPSGDQRDYLFAKHFNLPIIPIMDIQNIETEADPTKNGRYINSGFINGMFYNEATKAVIAKLEELGAGKAKVNFRMRDAIFGRQRYWGEPVPVYFKDGLPYLIDESELPLILPEVDKYLPTESGEPPLGRAIGWKYKPAPSKSPPGGETSASHLAGSYRETADPVYYEQIKDFSRDNRNNPTEAENILWQLLRNEQTGYKIRRQHAIGQFIADFVSLQKGLVIELDGHHHKLNKEADDDRTGILNHFGFEVIRFFNDEVLSDPQKVAEKIKQKLDSLPDRDQTKISGASASEVKVSPTGNSPTQPSLEGRALKVSEVKVSPTGGDLEGAAYELSTMPGWAGSSWYWYRYMDAHNDDEFASKKAVEYWKDVDLYIGGSEHATGHLLYSRFWNKFLKDMNLVVEEEPFKKLINQGMIQGRSNFVYRLNLVNDGEVQSYYLSKSKYDAWKKAEVFTGEQELLKEWKIPFVWEITNTMVPESKQAAYVSELHIDVNIVNNDILDIKKFRASRPEYQDAILILEDGSISSPTGGGREGAYICGVEIEKMSKSKFNVVNPDDLIERYGADTLRMYEMFLGPLEQSKPWNTNGIEGVFKFLRKFWRLFHNEQWEFTVADEQPFKAELKSLHKIIRKVEEDIERFSFNTSVSSFMIAVNELTDLKCNNKSILQDMVIILSPYAPHICEELWVLLGNAAGTLSYALYPKFNGEYLVEDDFAYPISINGKTKMNLSIPLSLDAGATEAFVLDNADVQKYLDGKSPKKVIVVKGRIVNMVV